ncbi:acyltransferase family protein [Streptomyces sp. NPDC059452]|uniref:acyltransferase family protein n=1 Tax=Streptomyces sp. NPDC059452 TaxID=3346835 RepID=UPI00369B97F5
MTTPPDTAAASRLSRLSRLRASARRVALAIDARTPLGRDRGLDGLRALALLAVPTGHWLVGGFTLDADGALRNASPLTALPFLAPVSWLLQLLGIFFLVGGYASARSYGRAARSGVPATEWLRSRLLRLGRPVLAVAAVWAVLVTVLHAAGVPAATVRTAATLVIQPLWFVGVYAFITALTPWCLRAARRLGPLSAGILLVTVAAVDFLRYGPYADAVPGWVSLVNLLAGWLFGYQLGVCWSEHRLSRRTALALLAGGAALFATLLLAFGYPVSMVGVPGEGRTNAHPPSLLVVALAAAQCGAAVLLRDRIGRALLRPALWAPVVAVNLCALTILCWHQTAMLATAIPGSFLGALPGLTTAPQSTEWVLARLLWLPVFALVLALIARYTRRFEGPWTGAGRARGVIASVLAAVFAAFALGFVS